MREEFDLNDVNDVNALILANDVIHLEQLTEHGTILNSTDDLGRIPLHFAASKNRIKVIEVLLKCGARIDLLDKNGNSALMIAAQSGAKEAAKLLLRKGINAVGLNNEGKSALDVAKEYGYADFIDIYISHMQEIKTFIDHRRALQAELYSKDKSKELNYSSVVGEERIQAGSLGNCISPEHGLPYAELQLKRLQKFIDDFQALH